MTYSDELEDYVKEAEGFLPEAKLDALAKPPRFMYGFGFTYTRDEQHPVTEGMTITYQEAIDRLRTVLDFHARCVNALVKRVLSQGQFDALVDFSYNEGPGELKRSDLLRYVNDGEDIKATNEFLKYIYDGNGNKQPGLVKRRMKESAWYSSGVRTSAGVIQRLLAS